MNDDKMDTVAAVAKIEAQKSAQELSESRKSHGEKVAQLEQLVQFKADYERALSASTFWSENADSQHDDLTAACFRALSRVVGAVLGRRGGLVVPKDVLVSIATNLVSNDRGGDLVGDRVSPLFDRAVEMLGYYRLPAQKEPVVLNGKGASASGKSSILKCPMRPQLWPPGTALGCSCWRKGSRGSSIPTKGLSARSWGK